MTRFELGGHGDPIPTIAIPDPNLSDEMPPQIIVMEESGEFHKEDWVGLGYTHFEVWCVGGAGGIGGHDINEIEFTSVKTPFTMSPSDWALYLEFIRIQDYFTAGEWDHQYSYGSGGTRTAVQDAELRNPTHQGEYLEFTGAVLSGGNGTLAGGAGGGGGLHLASGVLADLPDIVEVEVGQAGAEGASGQTTVNGAWIPLPSEITFRYNLSGVGVGNPAPGTPLHRMYEIANYFSDLTYSYPEPRTSFNLPPQPGEDGGTSSFNEDTAVASGGKGGKEAMAWVGGVLTRMGQGGDGGSGGRAEPGGGALGGTTDKDAPDGTWDGSIGKGGGGGRAGTRKPPPPTGPMFGV